MTEKALSTCKSLVCIIIEANLLGMAQTAGAIGDPPSASAFKTHLRQGKESEPMMVSIVCRHVAHLEPLAWPKLPTGAPISILSHHFPIFVFMGSMESRMPLESMILPAIYSRSATPFSSHACTLVNPSNTMHKKGFSGTE